ncbi:hypothetical protein JKP88DRAFT_291596 [Tribonema minus]|uniref:Condensation domain-containing protein n=1 Tax=Tribonema minus TaxID=303371 RepID=A0A835ZIW7_9STRA|nr:hypothetical protein JKP88DRAFT_291596 [Tribonema minus]
MPGAHAAAAIAPARRKGYAGHIPVPAPHHAPRFHADRLLPALDTNFPWPKLGVPKPPPFKSRVLGSFEKMLAKERMGSNILSTPHVWVAVVQGDVSPTALHAGIVALLARHPMLRASIQGAGLPEEVVMETIRTSPVDADPLRFVESECDSLEELAYRVITPEQGAGTRGTGVRHEDGAPFQAAWHARMEHQLEHAQFDRRAGPNWAVEAVRCASRAHTALVFTMNHAIEDQKSANTLLHELLIAAAAADAAPPRLAPAAALAALSAACAPPFTELPPSIEDATVAEPGKFGLGTARYLLKQAASGVFGPRLVHDHLPPPERRATPAFAPEARRTICEVRALEADELQAALAACRQKGLTLTAALSAAALLACSDVAHADGSDAWHNYKFLLAVDLRPFGAGAPGHQGKPNANGGGAEARALDWTEGAVACAGGAMDWVAGLPANSGRALVSGAAGAERDFWRLARRARGEMAAFAASGTAREAAAVFDWGMRAIEIGDVCEREARRPATLGRAYTCGVSNMGRYAHAATTGARVAALHYATSHSPWGSLYQLSCGTVGGRLCMTFQFAEPIVGRAMGAAFADALVAVLRAACCGGGGGSGDGSSE